MDFLKKIIFLRTDSWEKRRDNNEVKTCYWMIDTVLFDFGGTLFYEKRKIPETETVMGGYQALERLGLDLPPFEEFFQIFQSSYRSRSQELSKTGLEISLRKFCREFFPRIGLRNDEEIIDAYIWGRFQPHSQNDELYEDSLPALRALKPHKKIGLVSNAQPHGILWYLDTTGIVGYFDEIIISGAVGFRKPDRRIFELAADSICSEPESCLMVGDSPTADVRGSKEAGMEGVLIDRSGGFSDPDVPAIRSLRDIPRFIEGLERRG